MQIYQKQLATNSLASCKFYSDLFAEGITCSWSGAPTAYEDRSKSLTMALCIWRMDIFDLLYSNNYSSNLINITFPSPTSPKAFKMCLGVQWGGFAGAATSWSPQEHMSHHCPVENYLMKTPGQIWFGGQGFSLGLPVSPLMCYEILGWFLETFLILFSGCHDAALALDAFFFSCCWKSWKGYWSNRDVG